MNANLAYAEYGSTGHALSSLTVQRKSSRCAPSYAPRMATKQLPKFGFGERLKAARRVKGLSGTGLGIGAGEDGGNASRQTISDWEAERHYPKANQIKALCENLGIGADLLLFAGKPPSRPASHEVERIMSEVRTLTQQQRDELRIAMAKTPASDDDVERDMPITKTLKPKEPKK